MNSPKPELILYTETEPFNYTPSQTQIDMIARRLIPEIKRFFADEQIQKEFTEWKTNHIENKSDK